MTYMKFSYGKQKQTFLKFFKSNELKLMFQAKTKILPELPQWQTGKTANKTAKSYQLEMIPVCVLK